MAANVKLKIDADVKDANFKLDALKQKTDGLQKSSILGKGVSSLNGNGKMATAMATLQGELGNLASGAGSLTGALGKVKGALGAWGVAIGAVVAAATALYKQMSADVQAGMPTANEHEKLSAKLGAQLSQYNIDPEPIIQQFMLMAENGVASASHLADAFIKLVPTLDGGAQAAMEWVSMMADAEAATGLSADQLTTAVMQIQSQGKIEEEVAKKLPFWQELAKARGEEIAVVQKLVQSHEIGSQEMLEAMRRAVAGYKGTAAALSATTEGSLASMQAAEGRAKEAAAAAANDLKRAYYQERQAKFDLLAASQEYQAQMRAEGQIVGEVDITIAKVKDAWEEFMQGLIFWLDKIGVIGAITGEEGTIGERLDNRAIDNYDTAVHSYKTIGDATYYNAAELQKDLADFNDALAWMEKQGLDYDNAEAAQIIDNINKLINQIAEKEAKASADATKAADKQQAAATATEAASKEQQKAAEKQEEAAAKGKDWYTQSLMSKGADANTVAESMGYRDMGVGSSPVEQALRKYAELSEQAQNGNITPDGFAELEKVARIVDYYTKQQEEAARLQKEAAQKNLEAAKKYQDQTARGEELKLQSKMTEQQAGVYDKVRGLLDKMKDTNLSKKEQQAILSRELGKMIKGTVQGNKDAISANGVAGLKDFKFTDYTQVQVDTLAEIKKQGELAKEQLKTGKDIAQKLPSPTMAQ